jgi:cytochrome o ubiquinol oxidase subunit 2
LKKKLKVAFLVLVSLAVLIQTALFLYTKNMAVLDPKGLIAFKERDLLYITTLLMLTVVVPVLVLTVVICCKYRAGNKKAKYNPDWDNSWVLELVWWGFPCIIVALLSVLTFRSCLDLDPFKPLESNVKPLRIQVVALQWKWLFIYPEQKIASINFVQFPEKTPINFEITADAPMNSFWIPQLGGQIYAMPGMNTKLHLIADEAGSYRGSSSNISGLGFAGMIFTAKATSEAEFNAWVRSTQRSSQALTLDLYDKIALPTEYDPISLYSLKDEALYDAIIMKYMMP